MPVPPPTLRPYQAQLLHDVRIAWQLGQTPVLVLPTGAGKTVIFARAVAEHEGVTCVLAHRKELLDQISRALTKENVRHQILAPQPTIRRIVRDQTHRLGRCCYSTTAAVTVASVDSFRRADPAWIDRVSLWVIDEAHHLLRDNKWGKCISKFTNAKGLGVTATPIRADRKGLGAHADGFFDRIIEGPSQRELTLDGHLSPYQLFAPATRNLDLSKVKRGATGDFVGKQLRAAVGRSTITGDVVQQYLRLARGKRGVTFATGVAAAHELAESFMAAGVSAKAVHAKTPPGERQQAIDDLAAGRILQIVNVDLFGEGFDLPAIDVVSMARPTASYALYAQQFGRALRPSPGKTHALILDHAGNVHLHRGPPDVPRQWSLDAAARSDSDGPSPFRVCVRCSAVYPRTLRACPLCAAEPERAERSSPELVAGDLTQLDPEVLAALYDRAASIDRPEDEVRQEMRARHVPEIGVKAAVNRHRKNQNAQGQLRNAIQWWAGYQHSRGLDDPAAMRLFYSRFGIDVLSARSLKAKDANELRRRLDADLPPEILARAHAG